MKLKRKTIILLVSVLCLLLSACSDKTTERTAEASGTCGTDLKWYYQDSSLVISGSGAMTDFTQNQNSIPWENYKKKIEEITIEAGCTEVASSAFSDCKNLISVSISDSLTHIGDYAFSGCSKLETITLPGSLTDLGNLVFMGTGLTTVTIPASTVTILGNPFAGCADLESIDCQSPNFVAENGVLFSNDRSLLIAYPNAKTGAYSIPDSVTEIGISAFMGSSLTTIEIPESVTVIGNGAFWGCEKIKSITIPGSVTEIGNSAFRSCDTLSTVILAPGLARIGTSAFSDCVELSSVTIPEGVTELGDGAFLLCNGPILIPDSVEEIGTRTFVGVKQIYYNGTLPGSSWGAGTVSRYTDSSIISIENLEKNENHVSENDSKEYAGILPGTYLVGTDIPAGTYRLVPIDSSDAGYWKRCSDASGETNSIIANDLFDSTTYVTVKDGEYLHINRCTGALQ